MLKNLAHVPSKSSSSQGGNFQLTDEGLGTRTTIVGIENPVMRNVNGFLNMGATKISERGNKVKKKNAPLLKKNFLLKSIENDPKPISWFILQKT